MDRKGSIYASPDENYEIVELFLACRSLKNMDFLSKSDPVVILYVQNNLTKVYQEFGRTEMIKDNLNPNFATTFQMKFVFEEHQYLKLEVIDIDSETSFDTIGTAETTLGKIMGAKSQLLILDVMHKGSKNGKLIVRGEKVVNSSQVLNGVIRCENIPSLHWFGKTRPFFKLLKTREDNMHALAFQSEHVAHHNPVYKPFSVPMSKLCNGDPHLPITVEVWDYSDSGSHKYIATSSFSVAQLQSGTRKFPLENKKKHKSAGAVLVEQFSVVENPTFVDYIRGGLQLNLIAAIDYTASNGFAHNPTSLHHCSAQRKSQYQIAVEEVGSILMNYDYDQKVPLFGFGGKPRFPNFSSQTVLHCFPVNGNISDPELPGIEALIYCYRNSLQFVELNGPTLFTPLLHETMKLAQAVKEQGSNSYLILLILTDGEIHDMDTTKSAIVDSAFLPLSIIIVGIGNADFTNMEILDGDDGLIDSRGLSAKRDLVQFVPFNKYQGNGELLAKNVLAELPDQLVQYMKLINKVPNPPITADINQLTISIGPNANIQQPVPQTNYEYPQENSNYGLASQNNFGLSSQPY